MKEVNCKIELVPGGNLPWQKHSADACWDLFARKIEKISKSKYKIYLGIKLQPEYGFRIALYPRSSNSSSMWILSNNIGIGDNEYVGEYMAIFDCIPETIGTHIEGDLARTIRTIDLSPFPYEVGDRVVQMEIVPQIKIKWEVTEKLDNTTRGTGGFGSTGLK